MDFHEHRLQRNPENQRGAFDDVFQIAQSVCRLDKIDAGIIVGRVHDSNGVLAAAIGVNGQLNADGFSQFGEFLSDELYAERTQLRRANRQLFFNRMAEGAVKFGDGRGMN